MKGGKSKTNSRKGGDGRLAVKKQTKKKAPKDPNKPKRPPSAFFVFMEGFRKEFKEKHPNNKSVATVGKAGGEEWKSMSEEEKAPFVQMAEKRKEEYERKMEAYKRKDEEVEDESDKSKSEVNDDEDEEGSGDEDDD